MRGPSSSRSCWLVTRHVTPRATIEPVGIPQGLISLASPARFELTAPRSSISWSASASDPAARKRSRSRRRWPSTPIAPASVSGGRASNRSVASAKRGMPRLVATAKVSHRQLEPRLIPGQRSIARRRRPASRSTQAQVAYCFAWVPACAGMTKEQQARPTAHPPPSTPASSATAPPPGPDPARRSPCATDRNPPAAAGSARSRHRGTTARGVSL
jgi:hypothetical protein